MFKRINDKCVKNNLTFIKFNNIENKYINNKTKLLLKCNKCGYEWGTTTYDKFISRKSLCAVCSKKKRKTKNEYIVEIKNRCQELNYKFNGFVDENKINGSTKLILKCNRCGREWRTTTIINFLRKDRKNHKCGKNNPKSMIPSFKNKEILIKDIINKLKNGNLKFIGFHSEYKGVKKSKIKLTCTKCGKEIIVNYSNINNNCKNCEKTSKILNKCLILDYSFLGFDNKNNTYKGKNTKLILKCNKCGRIWKTSSYCNFIYNTIKCVGCTNTWKLEKEVKIILEENNIKYEEQKSFDWLTNKFNLYLDFYLPEYYSFIECQGRQHFVSVDAFGGDKGFKETKHRDLIKLNKCLENGIKPIYYSTKEWTNFNGIDVVNNKNDLLKKIKNG